jgi:hypothetical protein
MNEVWRTTQPLLGGGSRTNDCLAVWDFAVPGSTAPRPIPGAKCHDGDLTCDADATPGRCGFDLQLCFNIPDPRLPGCDTNATIQSYRLGMPSNAGDAVDVANANAITSLLPSFPIDGAVCTGTFRFVVPVGSKSIRFAATSADGRTDDDKLRLTCLPAQ